jgi:hypothetical protein
MPYASFAARTQHARFSASFSTGVLPTHSEIVFGFRRKRYFGRNHASLENVNSLKGSLIPDRVQLTVAAATMIEVGLRLKYMVSVHTRHLSLFTIFTTRVLSIIVGPH